MRSVPIFRFLSAPIDQSRKRPLTGGAPYKSPKEGGGALFWVSPHLTTKERPCHVHSDLMPSKQIIGQSITQHNRITTGTQHSIPIPLNHELLCECKLFIVPVLFATISAPHSNCGQTLCEPVKLETTTVKPSTPFIATKTAIIVVEPLTSYQL